MTPPIAPMTAAVRLLAVLEAENDALQKPDVAGVGALLAEKAAATAGLLPLPDTPEAAALAQRLQALAGENRRLLERAMAVQSRVVELVARAAQRTARDAGRYGATGVAAASTGGYALTTSA